MDKNGSWGIAIAGKSCYEQIRGAPKSDPMASSPGPYLGVLPVFRCSNVTMLKQGQSHESVWPSYLQIHAKNASTQQQSFKKMQPFQVSSLAVDTSIKGTECPNWNFIWRNSAPLKVQFFAWLLGEREIPTKQEDGETLPSGDLSKRKIARNAAYDSKCGTKDYKVFG
uniref:Reverse transcriptase zinc-binding domain-containing protein n=1 Tax=Oryza brachyantha TaxID=4533 RepID=J3MEN4_ORYBR